MALFLNQDFLEIDLDSLVKYCQWTSLGEFLQNGLVLLNKSKKILRLGEISYH